MDIWDVVSHKDFLHVSRQSQPFDTVMCAYVFCLLIHIELKRIIGFILKFLMNRNSIEKACILITLRHTDVSRLLSEALKDYFDA